MTDPAPDATLERIAAAAELGRQGDRAAARARFSEIWDSLPGDCYRRLGDTIQARVHLDRGFAAVDALPDDGYGRMTRAGLERLGRRLALGTAGFDPR